MRTKQEVRLVNSRYTLTYVEDSPIVRAMFARFMQHCDRWFFLALQFEYMYMRMYPSWVKRCGPRVPLWVDAVLERLHLMLCDGDARQAKDYLLEWAGSHLDLVFFAEKDNHVLIVKFERTKLPSRKKKHATTSIGK